MPGLWNSFEEERDKGVRQSRHRLQRQRLLQKRQRAELQELIVERLIQLIVQERFLKEERLILKEGFVEFVEVIIVGLLIRRFRVQVPGGVLIFSLILQRSRRRRALTASVNLSPWSRGGHGSSAAQYWLVDVVPA